MSVSLSEAEVHWRTFLQSLCERKLHGVKLIARDAHPGLKAAIRTVLASVSPSCLSSENKHEV